MLKFFRYVNERNGAAIVPEFKKPPVKYKGIPEMFDEVLKHEKFISASINEVLEAAMADKDHATVMGPRRFETMTAFEFVSINPFVGTNLRCPSGAIFSYRNFGEKTVVAGRLRGS